MHTDIQATQQTKKGLISIMLMTTIYTLQKVPINYERFVGNQEMVLTFAEGQHNGIKSIPSSIFLLLSAFNLHVAHL